MPVKILRGAITPSSPRFSPGFSRFLQVSPGPTVSDYCLPPDFGSHIFFLQKTWFTICSLRIFKSSYGSEDEIEETVKPFTTYLLQLEKVIRDSILYASSEREVAGRRRHFKRFFASDCRISKGFSFL